MPLSSRALARSLELAAVEAATLAGFLNDLDGWDGSDCDTGANARLTLEAMRDAVARLEEGAPFAQALEEAIAAGVVHGQGHIGVILAQTLAAWSKGLEGARAIAPVTVRRMLKAPIVDDLSRCDLSPSISAALSAGSNALDELGDTLPDEGYVVSWYSLAVQSGLIEAAGEGPEAIDPGASVLALLFACFDAAVGGDQSVLESFARMLSDLAERNGASPRPHSPSPGRDFAVDVVWQGTASDAGALVDSLSRVGARFSSVGVLDPFGVGLWRLHVDTSAPLAARPRSGRLIRFAVADARTDEELGVDELADEGISHRGVRLLERRPLRRVERARVIACTHAPGILEDLARTGAVVLLDPSPEDAAGILALAAASATGVGLFIPCDSTTAALGAAIAKRAEGEPDPLSLESDSSAPARLLVAGTRDELAALAVAQATGGLFVPQPGGSAAAPAMERILAEAERAVLASHTTRAIENEDPVLVAGLFADLDIEPTRAWRLLVSRGHGPELVALVRQMAVGGNPWSPELEVLMGGQPGPSLLQRIEA